MTAPTVNSIWRFYLDHHRRWKWQRLSVDRTVLEESASAYKDYEACLADAREHGHVFLPSQPRLVKGDSN